MEAVLHRDDPWRRLAWVLPTAMLLTALATAAFLRLLSEPAVRPQPPAPIQVQLLELPSAVAPPAPAAPPAPEPPPPAPPEPPPEPAIEPAPQAVQPPPPPRPVRPPRQRQAPRKEAPPTPPAQTQPAPPAPAPAPAPSTAAPAGGNMGARAIYKPMPELPSELRRRSLDLVAVARFTVAADGSARIELIGPTPDAELNRVLLDALSKWRFFPALQDGHPTASVVELRIPVSVR